MASWQPPSKKERGQAMAAQEEFDNGKYEDCTQTLQKLAVGRPGDLKVMHNIAVAAFYASGSKNITEFLQATTRLLGQPVLESCNEPGDILLRSDEEESEDDSKNACILFNQAIVMYYLVQYHVAIELLDKISGEGLSDHLACSVLYLKIECLLVTFQTEKALAVIEYVETKYLSNLAEGQTPFKCDAGAEVGTDFYREEMQQFKLRCYIQNKSLKKLSKKDLKTLMNSTGNATSGAFLKANFEYRRGNQKKAVKVMQTAPHCLDSHFNIFGHDPNAMFENNMALVYFTCGKPTMALVSLRQGVLKVKELMAGYDRSSDLRSRDQFGRGFPLQCALQPQVQEMTYNMGLIHLFLGQSKSAFDCLLATVETYFGNARLWLRVAEACIGVYLKAISKEGTCEEDKPRVADVVGTGKHRKLVLISQRYQRGDVIGNEGMPPPFSKTDAVVSARTAVQMSMAVDHTQLTEKSKASGGDEKTQPIHPGDPKPSLSFAYLCLKNARFVMKQEENDNRPPWEPTSPKSEEKKSAKQFFRVPPSNPVRLQEWSNLKCAVLIASAYVGNVCADYLMVVKYIKQLLTLPEVCGIYRYLANMYNAYAYIMLDRISDALDCLQPDCKELDLSYVTPWNEELHHTNVEIPTAGACGLPHHDLRSLQDGSIYTPSPEDAATSLLYNMCMAYTMRGDLDKAAAVLEKALTRYSKIEVPLQLQLLQVYVALMSGQIEKAIDIIRSTLPDASFPPDLISGSKDDK